MRGVRLALAAGLTVTAVALGIVLSHAPVSIAGTNGVSANFGVEFIRGRQAFCQRGGVLPAGTTAIRVSLSANIGPQVSVDVYSLGRLVDHGSQATGWGVDETVTVPIGRVAEAIPDVGICVRTGPSVEPIQVNGVVVKGPSGREALLRMEYLRSASGSWLSRVGSIAQRMGLARAPSGAWVAYVLLAAMVAVAVLASRLVLRELR
jgi:hypothetical protein